MSGFPIITLLVIGFWILRAASNRSQGRSAPQRRFDIVMTAQGFTRWLTLPGFLFAVHWLWEEPSFPSVCVAGALLVWNSPATVTGLATRYLTPRNSYLVAVLFHPYWTRSDGPAGAIVAIARSRALEENEQEWCRDQLRERDRGTPLSVLAWAALDANAGDPEGARERFRAVAFLDKVPDVEPARAMAREWLVADALGRGDRDDLVDLCRSGPWGLRWRTLGRIVDRLAHGEPGGLLDIALLGLGFGRWRLAGSLLFQAPFPPLDPIWMPKQSAGSALAHARAATALAASTPMAATIADAAAAWSRVGEDRALRARLARRSLELSGAVGHVDADPLGTVIAGQVESLTRQLLQIRRFPAVGDPLLVRAADDALDAAFREMQDRTEDLLEYVRLGPVTAVDSHRRWEPIRHLATAIVRDRPERHREVWMLVCGPCLHASADLYNRFGQKVFGGAVFRWLLAFGSGVMSSGVEQTLRENVRIA